MTKHVSTKRALILSLLSMLLCVSMLVGSTYAWFTDTATTSVNTIQAGTLDVALEMKDNDGKWVSAEGKTLQFLVGGEIPAEETKIYWEPGCTYRLPDLRVVNNGNLAIKYKVMISGIKGDAELNKVIDWTIGEVADGTEKMLAPNGTAEFTITGKMSETAGNEYQGLSIDGISIMVYATQAMSEKDSKDETYDENAGKDTAFYTLKEFNALTEIPEGIKNVYLNIGEVSLKDGGVTIGNKSMADIYTAVTGDYTVGQELDDGRVVTSVWNASKNIYLANSNKAGINLYISGSVKDNPEGGLLQSNSHSLGFVIPDASNIVFTKDFTVNGYFRCYFSWNDNQTLGGGVASHKIQSVLFDHSTFNGIWIQNGGFLADSLTFDGCAFNAYENKTSPNDSNPLWFCNINSCDVTIKNCTFKASRPIKVVEQTVSGANITITDNKFDMSLTNSANKDGEPKNDAIMFSDITDASTLGDVVISGNEVTGANALLTFFNPSKTAMADGATFTVSGNTLNGAQLSVGWKSATAYKPDFVTVK